MNGRILSVQGQHIGELILFCLQARAELLELDDDLV